MDLTPRGSRLHIAVVGKRNAGKSSVVNAITRQESALVSPIAGTTTDPVFKSMEMLPLGPVVLIDTGGVDDQGELGLQRVRKTLEVINKADLIVLVIDANEPFSEHELKIIRMASESRLPVVAALNKVDICPNPREQELLFRQKLGLDPVWISTRTGSGIEQLKESIIKAGADWENDSIIGDLLKEDDIVVLVTPIDAAAPKGRLILPQVQTLRDILDRGAKAFVVQETGLKHCLENLRAKPKIVITDSQVFAAVDQDTPRDVWLTSFSVLFARYKGDLTALVEGAKAIWGLVPGDKVLIAEGCTHHRVKDDIGSVKIPRWLEQFVGGRLQFGYCSGYGFPRELTDYKLVVHCGACMLNRREMLRRIREIKQAGVPIVNYGVCIAFLQGILRRALAPFPDALRLLDDVPAGYPDERGYEL